MKVIVDRGRCTGIGICESVAEAYFEVGDDGSLTVLRDDVASVDEDEVVEAVRSCPARALTLNRDPE
ncbi:ferredoxin [Rhodococcus koreensis]